MRISQLPRQFSTCDEPWHSPSVYLIASKLPSATCMTETFHQSEVIIRSLSASHMRSQPFPNDRDDISQNLTPIPPGTSSSPSKTPPTDRDAPNVPRYRPSPRDDF